jgi:hypothetical protein
VSGTNKGIILAALISFVTGAGGYHIATSPSWASSEIYAIFWGSALISALILSTNWLERDSHNLAHTAFLCSTMVASFASAVVFDMAMLPVLALGNPNIGYSMVMLIYLVMGFGLLYFFNFRTDRAPAKVRPTVTVVFSIPGVA